MINELTIKCQNIITFIPTNIYIHSNEEHDTVTFQQLEIPYFLTRYIESSINNLLDKKEKEEDKLYDKDVFFYKDPFKMCYLTWPLTYDNQHYTITLGPMITDQVTSDEVKYMGYKMKLSSDNCFILESFYGIVPYFDQDQLNNIASFFLSYLPLSLSKANIITEDHSISMPIEAKAIESKFEQFDYVERNHAIEKEMLNAVEHGNIDYINKISFGSNLILPPRFPSDPLRERKNLAITLNSITLRAALKGGLNASIAHSLSHNFAIEVENQITTEGIDNLNAKILKTYTESVRKYSQKGRSELIGSAINVIRTHLVHNISLSVVSDALHVRKEHLSRQFKKEMGITVTDFIHQSKIEESCDLLVSRKFTISDIAYTFGYSSPAHYTKIFKKFMDMSPKEYRNIAISKIN